MAKRKVGNEKFSKDLEPLVRSIDGLDLDANNARLHSARNIDAIRNSIRRFGQAKPIVVRDGVVICGNGTLRAAVEEGWENIAVTEFEGTEEEAAALAIADNQTAALAEWDWQQLAETLAGPLQGFDIGILGFEDYEIDPILAADWTPPETDPDADFSGGDGPKHKCPECEHEW